MDCVTKCSRLSERDITVHVSTAEFTAQTLSLSYLSDDFVRGRCSYKLKILLEQSDSLEMV